MRPNKLNFEVNSLSLFIDKVPESQRLRSFERSFWNQRATLSDLIPTLVANMDICSEFGFSSISNSLKRIAFRSRLALRRRALPSSSTLGSLGLERFVMDLDFVRIDSERGDKGHSEGIGERDSIEGNCARIKGLMEPLREGTLVKIAATRELNLRSHQ